MNTEQGFAIWITGLPASGKSTITGMLVARFHLRGIFPVVLESDAVRKILTPEAVYSDAERDRFYNQLVRFGELLTRYSVPVIFDATANRQVYRDLARELIPQYLEIFVDTPIDVCRRRDPKGIYRSAERVEAPKVPGLNVPYERSPHSDLVLDGRTDPGQNAARILERVQLVGFI